MPSRIDLLRFWVSCERELTLQGNLLNLHSGKYSGLANAKVIDISANAEGGISVTKVTADGGKVAGARRTTNLRRSTGPRRANKIAAVETAAKGFRADLRPVSLRSLPLPFLSFLALPPLPTCLGGERVAGHAAVLELPGLPHEGGAY